MKLWLDDFRPAPEGYEWVDTVNKAKEIYDCAVNAYREAEKYPLEGVRRD